MKSCELLFSFRHHLVCLPFPLLLQETQKPPVYRLRPPSCRACARYRNAEQATHSYAVHLGFHFSFGLLSGLCKKIVLYVFCLSHTPRGSANTICLSWHFPIASVRNVICPGQCRTELQAFGQTLWQVSLDKNVFQGANLSKL